MWRGGVRIGIKMIERFNSRAGEYRDQAAKLRVLAYETRFAESRRKLLMLADSFEKLAERWKRGEAPSRRPPTDLADRSRLTLRQ